MKDTIYDLIDGQWHVRPHPFELCAKGMLADAVVAHCSGHSYETGHVGWFWWAVGRMGKAESLEDAKRAAEAVVGREERAWARQDIKPGGACEGELPTDCPGYRLTPEQKEDIYRGECDFVDGKWYRKGKEAKTVCRDLRRALVQIIPGDNDGTDQRNQ